MKNLHFKKAHRVIIDSFASIARSCRQSVTRYPYPTAILLALVYLLLFQHNFITTGDAWAESYAEYLDESVRFGWGEVFAQNWAGYFSLVPSFIAKAYVFFNFPLGYIDWFYRAVTILFTVFTAALFALKANRLIVKSDALRILLSLAVVVSLFDITSFSFINIWYIAFLPIVFIYLSHKKISDKMDIGVGIFGALMSLTKPFLVLMPIIIYRAIRTRQWIGPTIFLIAATLQTYQIVFNDRRQLVENTSLSINETVGGIFVGSGVALLKLFGVMPLSFWYVAIANIILFALAILLWRKKGFWTTAILCSTFIFAVYTYVLAPDLPAYRGLNSYTTMYSFNYKTQREIIVNGILLITFFILLDSFYYQWRKSVNKFARKYTPYVILCTALLVITIIYKPIDTTSAGVSTGPINSFRTDLNNNLPTCIPLSPTPVFVADTNWVYAHKGTCVTPNHDTNIFKPDFAHMNTPVNNTIYTIDASYFRLNRHELTAIVIPVINNTELSHRLEIIDASGKTFTAKVDVSKEIQFITFNTRGIPRQDQYVITIRQSGQGVRLGQFTGTRQPIVYTYFLNKQP
jgi:hypothetical protein